MHAAPSRESAFTTDIPTREWDSVRSDLLSGEDLGDYAMVCSDNSSKYSSMVATVCVAMLRFSSYKTTDL